MISRNVSVVLDKIAQAARKANRSVKEIVIIGVTKAVAVDKILEAIDCGITNIGESKLQEAEQKIPHLIKYAKGKSIDLKFHMIGHLQTNKVNKALGMFDMIQSVDSLRLAEKINQSAINSDKNAQVLIEVNVSGEDSKFGLATDDALSFMKKMSEFERVRVRGLMTMAPFVKDKEDARPYFRRLRHLRDKLMETNDRLFKEKIRMDYLSMGMSQDYEEAVEEGSNMVRIGTAIFGERL